MTEPSNTAVAFRPLARLTSTGRATRVFLRRQLWAWPLLATLLLGLIGWWVNRRVEGAMREQLADELTTLRDADVTALRLWLEATQADAQALALDPSVRAATSELIDLADAAPRLEPALREAPPLARLRQELLPQIQALGYDDFIVADGRFRVLAARDDLAVGISLGGSKREFLQRVLAAGASVSRPFFSNLLLPDADGEHRLGVPTMFAAAPIRAEDGAAVAVLGLRLRPEGEFTRILRVARRGRTGETYAFDRDGRLLSESRFDDHLKQVGLLPDHPGARSILAVELRDPQVNLVEGRRPPRRRAEQPLTRMAAAAVAGTAGVDVDGYRDYRGVPVVGAWTWLPEYGFGLATEVDVAEALRPLYILRETYGGLLALLALSAVAIFLFMLAAARQRRALQQAVLQARRLGQYTLEQKIGSGGMGSVYRARHALLRRPTAIKLLDVDNMSETAVARFEREVQLTSQLSHPNTIAIYDYGRTPEGIFYYAMEYLDGISLEDLVARFGPVPDGRVAAILSQVCGSLAEAHAAGLIHRDIKPANIHLSCRGGLYDFVTVLDFGLVKPVGDVSVTASGTVAGTPLYLSPEAIEQTETVDLRTDLYAVGAVGYFLLTATPVFPGPSIVDLCLQHVSIAPEPPSRRLGRPLSPRLEALILRCLSKERAGRPASAAELGEALERCDDLVVPWSRAEAAAWWTTVRTGLHRDVVAPPTDVLAAVPVAGDGTSAPVPGPPTRRPEPTTIVELAPAATEVEPRPPAGTSPDPSHIVLEPPRPSEPRPEISTVTELPHLTDP